jgi:hypothetical protein
MAYAPAINLGPPQWLDAGPTLVLGAYGGAGVTTVSLATITPVGAKGAFLFLQVNSATANRVCRVQQTGTAVTAWAARVIIANQINEGSGLIKLDANRAFDVNNSAALEVQCALYLLAYYMGG